jgi:serine/threonine protein kinase
MKLLPKKTVLNNKYIIKQNIKKTDMSNIYIALNKKNNEKVIIKELFFKGCFRDLDGKNVIYKNKKIMKKYKKEYLKEGKILKKIKHPNIVKHIDMFEENNTIYIVLKYYEGKTYDEYIKNKKINIRKEINKNIFQILDAIHYLHKKQYLHRDIKPNNIIITKEKPILIDFGSSNHIKKSNKNITTLTHGFSPLEFYGKKTKHGAFSDIYSISATLYYLKNKKIPYPVGKRVIIDEFFNKNKSKITTLDKVIFKNLSLNYKDRAKNIKHFKKELEYSLKY